MKKLLLSIFTITTFFQLGYSQKTYVPDDNFEAYLEANGMGDGINNNDSVTTANISGITNLNVGNQNISDLSGLEAFSSLTVLNCGGNPQLTYLDVSQNYALVSISSRSSGLININFGTISNIKSLDLLNNQLTSLDLTSLVQLEATYFRNNQLTSLDVSQNVNLKNLKIEVNQISSIDISQNTQLTYLSCWNNQITALDVSQNLLLETISVGNNQIPSLDVTMLDSLENFYCGANLLTSLDISQNPLLSYLSCGNNQLTNLDLSQNPLLSNVECQDNLISALDVTMLDSLTLLNFARNLLTSVDVTQNPVLEYLNCQANQITALDVSQNPLLSYLRCPYNQIPTLDVTMLDSLTLLYCAGNLLTSLDVTQNPLLETLLCHGNQIPTLDVTQNPLLETLLCYNNQITILDVTQNSLLKHLECGSNLLSTLDVTQNSLLEELYCGNNQLTQLDFSNNSALESVRCNNNDLTSLDLRNGNNTFITELRAQQNDSLFCVSVDNSTYSDTAWLNPLNTSFNFDTIVSFSNSCNPCQTIYVTEFQSDCDSVVWNGTSYFSSGIYTDSLLTINGCDSIVTLDVDITGANLAFTVAPVSLIAPPFIFPFNNTTPNMGNFDFTWDFGDGTVIPTNNINITHEYQYNGVYSVKLISEDMVNNCGIDTLEKPNLINCSGGPSLSIAQAFSNLVLYPNPATYMVNIDYGTEENFNNHYVEIVNSLGQQVFINTIDASNIQIPVSNLGSKGLYFINIRNESNEIIVAKHLIIN